MIEAFLETPEGDRLFKLVRAFDFKILPRQFRDMTQNEIKELLVMREKAITEDEIERVRRR